jgi:uncharacterized protein YqjF (DUF2071 family)
MTDRDWYRGPWIMAQRWHDLLFAHWPIAVDVLRPLIPSTLDIDTVDGQAWIGVVPFHMSGVRPRALLPVQGLSAFPELNVRTYVRPRDRRWGRPGVWFFSLDAANQIAVAIARRFFHLPYVHARMSLVSTRDTILYASERIHRDTPKATFRGSYAPAGDVAFARPGSLEDWLTNRYCLYTQDRRARLLRCDINHAPWPLQPAEAQIEINTMTAPYGIDLPAQVPLLHFSKRLDVVVWRLRRAEMLQ